MGILHVARTCHSSLCAACRTYGSAGTIHLFLLALVFLLPCRTMWTRFIRGNTAAYATLYHHPTPVFNAPFAFFASTFPVDSCSVTYRGRTVYYTRGGWHGSSAVRTLPIPLIRSVAFTCNTNAARLDVLHFARYAAAPADSPPVDGSSHATWIIERHSGSSPGRGRRCTLPRHSAAVGPPAHGHGSRYAGAFHAAYTHSACVLTHLPWYFLAYCAVTAHALLLRAFLSHACAVWLVDSLACYHDISLPPLPSTYFRAAALYHSHRTRLLASLLHLPTAWRPTGYTRTPTTHTRTPPRA